MRHLDIIPIIKEFGPATTRFLTWKMNLKHKGYDSRNCQSDIKVLKNKKLVRTKKIKDVLTINCKKTSNFINVISLQIKG